MSTVKVFDNKTKKLISAYDVSFCPRAGDTFEKVGSKYSVMSTNFEVTSYGGLRASVYVELINKKPSVTYNVEQKQLKRIAGVVIAAQDVIDYDAVNLRITKDLRKALENLTEEDCNLLELEE